MPLTANLADVFQKLYARLRISQATAQGISPTTILEQVRLTYQINGLVDQIISGTDLVLAQKVTAVAANGSFTITNAVPAGHRHKIRILFLMHDGTWEFTFLMLYPGTGSIYPRFAPQTGADTLYYENPGGILLKASWVIQAQVANYSVAGNITCNYMYEDELSL